MKVISFFKKRNTLFYKALRYCREGEGCFFKSPVRARAREHYILREEKRLYVESNGV